MPDLCRKYRPLLPDIGLEALSSIPLCRFLVHYEVSATPPLVVPIPIPNALHYLPNVWHASEVSVFQVPCLFPYIVKILSNIVCLMVLNHSFDKITPLSCSGETISNRISLSEILWHLYVASLLLTTKSFPITSPLAIIVVSLMKSCDDKTTIVKK